MAIPIWVWPVMAIVGYVVWFASGLLINIPGIDASAIVAKPIGILMTLIGIFMYGGAGVSEIYQTHIKELKEEVALATKQSKDANSKIKTVVRTKIKTVHDKQTVVKNQIQTVEKVINAECKIDPAVIKIHNDAAKNPNTDTAK